jgi:hypothetical protein
LGTVIVNNFIWDAQNEGSVGAASYDPSEPGSKFLAQLGALYTLGSPIAVWSLKYPDGGDPISLPQHCVWRNIYCPSDIIGWPVRGINDKYARVRNLTDYRMWVGGLLSRWNPMSHLGYTGNKRVRSMIVADIRRLLSVS